MDVQLTADVLLNSGLTVIISIMGWFMKLLMARVEKLEKDHEIHVHKTSESFFRQGDAVTKLDKEFANYREFIARSYPTREETNSNFQEVKRTLEKILERLDEKADRS